MNSNVRGAGGAVDDDAVKKNVGKSDKSWKPGIQTYECLTTLVFMSMLKSDIYVKCQMLMMTKAIPELVPGGIY